METDYLLRQEALRQKLMENQPTLRDQFAMSALALFANPRTTRSVAAIAKETYRIADAMLKEREVKT